MIDFDEASEDELWNELSNAEGFAKGHLLLELHSRKAKTGEFGLAFEFAQQAANVFDDLGSERDRGLCIYLMGKCKFELGNYQDALHYYEEATEPTIHAAEQIDLATLEVSRARALFNAKLFRDAYQSYLSAERIYASEESFLNAHNAAIDVGQLELRFDLPEKALETFQRARDYVIGHDDVTKVANAEQLISTALIELGRFDEAVEHSRESYNLARTCPCSTCVPEAQLNLAVALKHQGKIGEALEFLDMAQADFHSKDISGYQGICILERGRIRSESEPEFARDQFSQALSIFKAHDWPWQIDRALVELALLDLLSGNVAKAKQNLIEITERALELERLAFLKKINHEIELIEARIGA